MSPFCGDRYADDLFRVSAAAGKNREMSGVVLAFGLTCNEQNFITKARAQRYAAELGLVIVAPDTSPRGSQVADDKEYDLGQGAGFYVNATLEPWKAHYQMYDYILDEPAHPGKRTFRHIGKTRYLRALDGRARSTGAGAA